ncbi:class I SAM-dependent methyltransferase [Treponema parvum]|uniref:Class I SAM-dependent methyltransferase n=1 Tax=Treponema parvum TaxID=138851 RepID=A0A975IDQ4_9SPIR|nr:class I SAM-dependent methyltransferase [Treponema parvum]QTQ13062.1 class I SAM-dependent methyltransferase [Treponema parvum]
MDSYQDENAAVIDRWITEGWEWGKPVDHETYMQAKSGQWSVLLTPTKPVPREWLGDLKGKKLLGLASGGGQQMPIFIAAEAECTVLDYSEKQLESERAVANHEGYRINIVRADMSKPLPFADASFDIIFNPVSNCYIEKVEPVFSECFRVLKKGGVLLCGLDIGINYIVDQSEERIINALPFNPLVYDEHRKQLESSGGGWQFSHTIAEQIGSQIRAGFTLTDIYEDTNGEGRLHELHIPSFIATRAVK